MGMGRCHSTDPVVHAPRLPGCLTSDFQILGPRGYQASWFPNWLPWLRGVVMVTDLTYPCRKIFNLS